MLKKILSISGKPGLFELVTYGKNMIIVKSLVDGKRQPAYTRDRIISLGDIAMYTTSDDVPLWQVLTNIAEKNGNKPVDAKSYDTDAKLEEFLEAALPNFDRDRVYKTDIKKLINWYNILVGAGITDFKPKEEEADKEAETADEPKADK